MCCMMLVTEIHITAATSGEPNPKSGDALISLDDCVQLPSSRPIVCSPKTAMDLTYLLHSRMSYRLDE
jgi:hypothetical protein